MKTYLHAPEKELGKCFFQASLILISVIFLGLICENPIASFLILLAGGWLTWTFVEYAIHKAKVLDSNARTKTAKTINRFNFNTL